MENNFEKVIDVSDEEGGEECLSPEEREQLERAIRASEVFDQNKKYGDCLEQDQLKKAKEESEKQLKIEEERREEERRKKCEKMLAQLAKSGKFDREASGKNAIRVRVRFFGGQVVERNFSKDDLCTLLLQWVALEYHVHGGGQMCYPREVVLQSAIPFRIRISGVRSSDRKKSLGQLNIPKSMVFHFSRHEPASTLCAGGGSGAGSSSFSVQ